MRNARTALRLKHLANGRPGCIPFSSLGNGVCRPAGENCRRISELITPIDANGWVGIFRSHTKRNAYALRHDQKGAQRAPHRSLLRATGSTKSEEDFNKPFIAICNSYTDCIPGHADLNEVGLLIKRLVREAGGVPFIFNPIGIDDGIAMGHGEMKYSLPSRELIADCVESMARGHCFDGMVCIPNCDKIIPGMLMGAMRVNIPTIFVRGGPMAAGIAESATEQADLPAHPQPATKKSDLISVFQGVGKLQAGNITCPTCRSCSGMFP